jgi:hypothetical protein
MPLVTGIAAITFSEVSTRRGVFAEACDLRLVKRAVSKLGERGEPGLERRQAS